METVKYEFTDDEVKKACDIIRKSFIELTDDVMPMKKRLMFARHFGKFGIGLVLKRQLCISYQKQREEAEANGEEFKSPIQMLQESKLKLKEQLAGDVVGDFESGFEF